jgi:predicted GNAT superfamily acetyltransferase
MPSDAWAIADEAARAAGVELRRLTELDDTDLVTEVMVATWGEHQLLPHELVRALQGSGNPPYGAFRDDRMIGFVLGFLGNDADDGIHVHSHMLAVVPDRRHAGVGYALKLAQRAAALDAGVGVVRWTFDPLQARNAYFNLRKLGAVADRFHRRYYGEMTDALNRDDRSDRLEARWELDRRPRGWPFPPGEGAAVLRGVGPPDAPRPERGPDPVPRGPGAALAVPRDYAELKDRDPGLAAAWRDAVADALDACIAAGLVAAAFDRGDEGTGLAAYALGTPEAVRDWPEP